ncbi:hypothetical protein ACJH41_23350 [Mycobacteroides chelonae]
MNAEITKIGQFLSAQPNLMVCGHLGLTPLTAHERREILVGISLYDALETVAVLQGQWDVAYTTTQRVDVIEGDFLEGGGAGGVCERALNRIVVYGDHLISPRATAQLQREIIESAQRDDSAQPVDRNVLTHLLLSITSEQNMRPELAGDVPTPAEIAELQRDMSKMGLEEMLELLKTIVPDEVASALFNQPLKYEIAVSNTFDVWFNEWSPRSKTSGLGTTPAEAFVIATGVDLIDVMRLGARIIKRSIDLQQVRFTRDELLADGASENAINLLLANMALLVDDCRAKLLDNRDVGAIGHQRYTLTQYPFLALDENTFIMLRHHWALDRLCGEQLFFEAWAGLSSRSLANRFKIAMSDAFEQFVGGILGRIVARSPHLRVIVGEDEMQAAWTEKRGQKPSVCDWMILGDGHCIVIDATNHAVKSEAAQGLATWDEYSAEIEEIFTQGKFEQLVSTIESVRKRGGWGDEKTDAHTMFAPLVVVPDSGIPSALLTQFDLVNRARKPFGHLQPQVYAPGVMQLADVQLLEGLADMGQKLAKLGNKPDMLQLIAAWRTAATAIGESSLQLYLERRGWPRPLSEHIIENGSKAVRRLLAND